MVETRSRPPLRKENEPVRQSIRWTAFLSEKGKVGMQPRSLRGLAGSIRFRSTGTPVVMHQTCGFILEAEIRIPTPCNGYTHSSTEHV